jgi:hypothetical protein
VDNRITEWQDKVPLIIGVWKRVALGTKGTVPRRTWRTWRTRVAKWPNKGTRGDHVRRWRGIKTEGGHFGRKPCSPGSVVLPQFRLLSPQFRS